MKIKDEHGGKVIVSCVGNKITNEKLEKTIISSNRLKEIKAKINRLRRLQQLPVGGYDFIRLNHYSFYR